MITHLVVFVLLAVNFVSAKPDYEKNQKLQTGIVSSNLLRRETRPVVSDPSLNYPTMLLFPRSALPMDPTPNRHRQRSSSRPEDRNRRQSTSSGVSSSAPINQTPSSPKTSPDRAQDKTKKEAQDVPLRESKNAQQHTSNSSQRQSRDQRRRPIETAQANIAREREDEQAPNRPSSPLNLPSATEALARDTSQKLSFTRFSQINLKAMESEHESWLNGARNNIQNAEINARARFMTGARDVRRPARIYNELKEARSAVKQTRDEAKARTAIAANALYSRPTSSPTTRIKIAQAGVAVERARGVSTAYYTREYQASLAASGQSRWKDYPGHVKKAYKANARTTAIEAYNDGLTAEYQSRLDNDALSKAETKTEREKLLKIAVESRKDFHAAAKIYYLRDQQYRDVRNKFVEGASSEDEAKEFPAVPRKKQSP